MISLTRLEFDAVSSELLEACFQADRRARPASADSRQRLKASAAAQPTTRPTRRVVAAVH
jgi:hypothetical protein